MPRLAVPVAAVHSAQASIDGPLCIPRMSPSLNQHSCFPCQRRRFLQSRIESIFLFAAITPRRGLRAGRDTDTDPGRRSGCSSTCWAVATPSNRTTDVQSGQSLLSVKYGGKLGVVEDWKLRAMGIVSLVVVAHEPVELVLAAVGLIDLPIQGLAERVALHQAVQQPRFVPASRRTRADRGKHVSFSGWL